ncbi:MAG TPA: valine--tRNA ligase [Candidatus Paceibacterota bacterium]|nr:valine--tRNA ligase [Candidatus Paceibacterota bacterium]
METRYDHEKTEPRIYAQWEQSGYFNPDTLPGDRPEPFTIVMPPPNSNGSLHVGHALFVTLQDIMIRFARMRGKKALWIPGADHAGFETQIVYERELEKQGRSRFAMKPEELYKEILAFTLSNKTYMENQIRSLGASCDWSREKFTLDPDVVRKTQQTFRRLYDDGLLYRGKRIVNWCVKHQTSLSDVETEFKDRKDPFYYFTYGPFTIGTARPETKFGDKYVVVHPADERYAQFKDGQKIELEWINGPITATVVKDEAIDMSFGTGAMTITPWHDPVDFEIAERHKLDKEPIIDLHGKLLPIAGEFAGMKIDEARAKIVEKLRAKGLLVKTDEDYEHAVRVCYKCERVIEPQVLDQWFVKMKPLADLALKAVAEKKIAFIPDRFEKVFTYWMEHTLDWNISRQIVWGIPIPAKICERCGDGVPDLEDAVTACPKCGGPVRKDTDTFDTWFSSGQWPLMVLGYPDGRDFKTFYPTDVMETAYDLVFKWIPRMVFFGLYLAGDVPFRTVYFHGLVNDAHGKKMSKSKGNVMNPLDMTAKYGTDALRISLVVGNPAGSEMSLSEDRIRGYRNFSTKIWNIARFIEMNRPAGSTATKESFKKDETMLAKNPHMQRMAELRKDVTAHIEAFEFHLAAEKLYHYVWHELADKVIEAEKGRLRDGSPAEREESYELLEALLLGSLKMLHPFMPFVTEEIWQIFRPGTMLIVEPWE